MLTKPVEAGTVKCEVYWPEKVNETLALKPTLQVRATYIQYFADFDMRSFELSNVSNDLFTNAVLCHVQLLMPKLSVSTYIVSDTNSWKVYA